MLNLSEQHLDHIPELVENANDLIQGVRLDGTLSYANRAWCATLGYAQEEIGRLLLRDLLHPSVYPQFMQAFETVLSGGNPKVFETTFLTKAGQPLEMELSFTCCYEHGQPNTVWSILRALAQRKQVENPPQPPQPSLLSHTEEMRLIAWEADAKTWAVTYVSPYAVELLGYPVQAWLNATFWEEHIHPEDRAWVVQYSREKSETLSNYELEYRMLALDGRVVWFRDIVTVKRMNTEPHTLCGFLIDITDRKKVEQREESRRIILERIAHGQPLAAILDAIVSFVEQESPEARCSILLLDQTRRRLIHGSAPRLPDFYNQAIEGLQIGLGVGSCGTAAYTNQRVGVVDIGQSHLLTSVCDLSKS